MESKSTRKYAGWYASYMNSPQGEALIECMEKRIEADDALIETVLGEIELAECPKEYTPEFILKSIKSILEKRKPVKVKKDFFEWTA